MVQSSKPPRNAFVAWARKIYNPVGFGKGYNAVLFIIFAGALLGFVLARLQFLSFHGVFCSEQPNAAPGECYWYNMPRYHVGIMLHLAGILPAAFLVIFQFVPIIRYRAIIYHKAAGHVILLLVLVGIAGALMIVRFSFGGDLSTQAMVGTLTILELIALPLAYYNIKRKQIDQHRAWMLRAWFWMGSIITLRLIMVLCALVLTQLPDGFYTIQSCDKLLYTLGNATTVYDKYPQCHLNSTVGGQVVVKASFGPGMDNVISALDIGFGMAAWLALFLHAAGIEIYLRLTPREAVRLRNISYQRQMELGMKSPGSAGLVLEKFADADPWVLPQAAGSRHRSNSAAQENITVAAE